jgi:phosphoglycolate phosphatase/pyrophosphatase PpaX
MRPAEKPLSLENWFKINFDPGVVEYFKHSLQMDQEELMQEYNIWHNYSYTIVPDFFPGIIDILVQYKNMGGQVVVISHSEKELIERDYKLKGFSEKFNFAFMPDMIFGWSHDEEKRKPSPLPVITALKTLSIDAKDSIIIDDLKPGVIMGKNTGIDIAAAGWSHNIPEIKNYMKNNSVIYLNSIKQLGDFLLG